MAFSIIIFYYSFIYKFANFSRATGDSISIIAIIYYFIIASRVLLWGNSDCALNIRAWAETMLALDDIVITAK